ncbi:NADH-quinone oxidoreductase, chain G [Acidimicrobium ferrooxidans DSM 10331]|uniref:NADH-quinone oxidoreductase n=1 Tax=Acidimicrobium ferrooxidans (strain DSM 10331 / JCM 15462 / NBRC 103882 / ICP) TaxID=525909 RepID=C7M2U3_ACIFD|nr:NADH-quinone oxidoreductase subunit NuoG [Acidimicrobium ferrooxidans]ACU53337.1 NADH-quinone oxidoreductase, chain G [Acidimicrobium ferrooxidans DSM 10331]
MTEQASTVTITLDGKSVTVPAGVKLIEALEAVGTYVPRFCYHPRMRPVGVCRMCLVEVSGPRGFSLQPSCFIDVADQMEVRTTSEPVRKAQHGVLEFLLLNHPLDCPVCDKGGECPLQDQAFAHGSGETRFIEEKRHYPKPIPVSPLILLDRERCIQCDRCTRFADEVAGDARLDFAGRGNGLRVATFEGEGFESVFAGNVVQICPVGALTATPYRFKARPWDLAEAASTCTSCSMGCQVVLQSSQNELTRVLGVDAEAINQGWLCDRGRFQVAAVNNREERLLAPRIGADRASWAAALDAVASAIQEAVSRQGPAAVGVIGGDRLSLEGQFAWARLARSSIATPRVDGVAGSLVDPNLWLDRLATVDAIDDAEVVVTIGVDLREELPVAWLRLRQRALAGGAVVDVAPGPTSQGEIATARIVLDPRDPEAAIREVAQVVGDRRALVIVGQSNPLLDSRTRVGLYAALLGRLPASTVLPVHRSGNAAGALVAGLSPGWWPGLVAGPVAGWAESAGHDVTDILQAARVGALGVLIVLDRDLGELGLSDAEIETLARSVTLVVASSFETATTRRAAVALPIAAWGEERGVTISAELRLGRLAAQVEPMEQAWPAWSVAEELRARLEVGPVAVAVGEVLSALCHVGGVVTTHDVHLLGQRADGPLLPSAERGDGSPPRLLDPMGTPGIASVRRQAPDVRLGNALDPALPAPSAGVRRASLATAAALSNDLVGATGSGFVPWIASALYGDTPDVVANPFLAPLRRQARARLAPSDASRLGLELDGATVQIGGRVSLPVALDDDVAEGVVVIEGMPSGWGELAGPGWSLVEVEALHGS